ncbi:hypothetical protein [Burkholderia multivorans]|uniref:hypothetical protein n=1 Tax=Burkholderia multivorans TaxID=87883 RepID=UPI001C22483E|nr:hypothetical protein [Burkholderia multivorans]MBU9311655.1 hypothetical protein [Burkholderia multivorans]
MPSESTIFYLKFAPLAALAIALVALLFNIKNYRRKAGVLVRGSVGFGSSIYGNDHYIHEITLENLKDRAITIYGIYVKIGHSYYIEVEDFEDNPFILKPFEIYQKKYGPIEFYSVNMKTIKLDNLIKDESIRKTIILSTSDGRYTVPKQIPQWHPLRDFFNNYMTAVIRPVRSTFDGKDMGANIRFVLEIFGKNGNKESVPIHPHDYRVVKFRNFQLTKGSLESKESLESFIQKTIDEGKMSCERFVVHDIDQWRTQAHEHYQKIPIIAKRYNAFQYFVLGRIGTILHNRKVNRTNRVHQQTSIEARSKSARIDTPEE